MKIRNRIASLLASLIICASFGVAQQPVTSAPAPSPAAPTSHPELYPIANHILLDSDEIDAVASTAAPSLVSSGESQPALYPIANHIQLVIEGKVINVHDGDTVTVLDQDNQKSNIRLQGIDAPELKQTFGSVSQQNLARLVLGKQVEIYWSKIDKYRRTVGTIMLDGHDVNIEQVKGGFAWHFKKYEEEQPAQDRVTYAAAELSARASKIGLWQEQGGVPPMPPGEWRQAVKAKRWGPPPPAGTIIGNKNSLKYHRPDCTGYRDMAEKNRVFFPSVAAAEAAGYKRAGNCPAEIVVAAGARPANAAPSGTTVANAVSVASAASTSSSDAASGAVVPATSPEIEPAGAPADNIPPTDDALDESETDEAEADEATASTPAAVGQTNNGQNRSDTAPATSPAGATLPPAGSPGAVVQPQANVSSTANTTGPIIGNKNSKVYHLPGCASYNRVSEKNQVRFATAAEAESAGYKLAGNCKKP